MGNVLKGLAPRFFEQFRQKPVAPAAAQAAPQSQFDLMAGMNDKSSIFFRQKSKGANVI